MYFLRTWVFSIPTCIFNLSFSAFCSALKRKPTSFFPVLITVPCWSRWGAEARKLKQLVPPDMEKTWLCVAPVRVMASHQLVFPPLSNVDSAEGSIAFL